MRKIIKPIIIFVMSVSLYSCGNDDGGARIVIGNSNVLFSLNELQYQDPFVVQVSDLDGNPVANSSVKIKLRSLSYNVGGYVVSGDDWVSQVLRKCEIEDINNNGVLDAGEDINSNGLLDPANSATIGAHPSLQPTLTTGTNVIVTDEFGFGYFSLTYPKSEANWVEVEITASIESSDSVDTAIYKETLPVLLSDVDDISIAPPGGGTSPYGADTVCTEIIE